MIREIFIWLRGIVFFLLALSCVDSKEPELETSERFERLQYQIVGDYSLKGLSVVRPYPTRSDFPNAIAIRCIVQGGNQDNEYDRQIAVQILSRLKEVLEAEFVIADAAYVIFAKEDDRFFLSQSSESIFYFQAQDGHIVL